MAKLLFLTILAVICCTGLVQSSYAPEAYLEELARLVDDENAEERQFDESAAEYEEEEAREFDYQDEQLLRELRQLITPTANGVNPTKPPTTKPPRPTNPLVGPSRPLYVAAQRCNGPARFALRSHCARYLECSPQPLRATIRTCATGTFFDAQKKTCAPQATVDCTKY